MSGAAQLGMGVAGAGLGQWIGGQTGAQLGFLVGSLAGAALFPQNSGGGKGMVDLHVTSSTYGAPIPRLWGTVRIGGNVIVGERIFSNDSSSGKGGMTGGGGQKTTVYNWSGAVGLCVGPATAILKIWADTKLVYDVTGQSGVKGTWNSTTNYTTGSVVTDNGIQYIALNPNINDEPPSANWSAVSVSNPVSFDQYQLKFRFYTGNETQTPDSVCSALLGVNNAQSFRGMAYIVFDNIPLLNYGNRVPNWTFEILAGADPTHKQGLEAFIGTDTSVVGVDSDTVLPDWAHNRVFLIKEGFGINSGIKSFTLNGAVETQQANVTQLYQPGNVNWRDVWSSAALYHTDDYVSFNSHVFHAVAGSMNVSPPPNWSSVTTYHTGDQVVISETTYTCLMTSTNNNPVISPTFWSLGGTPWACIDNSNNQVSTGNGGGAVVGQDGFIYVIKDSANRSLIAKIDPDSLTEVRGAFPGNTLLDITSADPTLYAGNALTSGIPPVPLPPVAAGSGVVEPFSLGSMIIQAGQVQIAGQQSTTGPGHLLITGGFQREISGLVTTAHKSEVTGLTMPPMHFAGPGAQPYVDDSAFLVDENRVQVCQGFFQGVGHFQVMTNPSGSPTVVFSLDGPQPITTSYALGLDNYSSHSSVNLGVYRIQAIPRCLVYDPATEWPSTNRGVSILPLGKIAPSDIDPSWAHFSAVEGIILDQTDHNIIFYVSTDDTVPSGVSQHYVIKVDMSNDPAKVVADNNFSIVDKAKVMWKVPVNSIDTNGRSNLFRGHIANGSFAFISPTATSGTTHPVYSIDTATGAFHVTSWDGYVPQGGQVYDDSSGSLIFYGQFTNPNSLPVGDPAFFGAYMASHNTVSNAWMNILVDRVDATGVPLSQVVTEICEMVRFVPADLDVTDLESDIVLGYAIAQQMTAASALLPLMFMYQFDCVESDDVLKFVKRGHSSIATIPNSDLARIDNKTNALVNETRVQEMDLPNQVSISWLDPTRDFLSSTMYARRPFAPTPTVFSANTQSEDVPVVFNPTDVKRICKRVLYAAWINRVGYKTKLPWQYMKYDPTDVLTLQPDETTSVLTRLSTVDIGADFSLEAQHIAEGTATYISNVNAFGGDGFNPQNVPSVQPTKMILMDTPLLRDIDDTGQTNTNLYLGVGGYSPTWLAATVYDSPDQARWTNVETLSKSMTWGVTKSVLGDTDTPFALDTVNTLTVSVVNGASDFVSATLTDVCNGANAMVIIKGDGTVEVIQFMTVTQNSDGTITLSNLLRGRRGTDTMTGGHTTGEVYALVSGAAKGIGLAPESTSEINAGRYYKAVSAGTPIENAFSISFVSIGRPWMPYAPVQVTATQVGSDLELEWVRRTRLGGAWIPFTGTAPLNEATESYEIDIYDAPGTTVLRTIKVSFGTTPTADPDVLYTAAQMTTDFGGALTTGQTLTLAVYQISAVVGRGFAKKVTVTIG